MDEVQEQARQLLIEAAKTYRKALPRFGWAGVATNAYKDKDGDILPLAKIQSDIAVKVSAVQAGAIRNYGLLDVMHNHVWTIGTCAYRKILDGTRMEIDFGFIDDEYEDVAEQLVGKRLTMSHEFRYSIRVGKLSVPIPVSAAEAIGLKFSRMTDYIAIDTFRFTVAKVGDEANSLTTFRCYELTK